MILDQDHADSVRGSKTNKNLTFVIEEDPYAFTEASSSLWTTNDPVRAVEVAKRQRLSTHTEQVDRMREEERAHVEDVEDDEYSAAPTHTTQNNNARRRVAASRPSSSSSSSSSTSTTSSSSIVSTTTTAPSSRAFSSFRLTTSLQLAEEDDGMDLARSSVKRKLDDIDTEKTKDADGKGNTVGQSKEEEEKKKKKRRIEIPASVVADPASRRSTPARSAGEASSRVAPDVDAEIISSSLSSASVDSAVPTDVGSSSRTSPPRQSGLPQKLKIYARKKSPASPTPMAAAMKDNKKEEDGVEHAEHDVPARASRSSQSPPRFLPTASSSSGAPPSTSPMAAPPASVSESFVPSQTSRPAPSSLSPPTPPPSNKPPIKFSTPERKIALKHAHRSSPPAGVSPTSSSTTTTTPTKSSSQCERPNASRFMMTESARPSSSSASSAVAFSSPVAQPRYISPGSLAPPNLGELTRKLRQSTSSSSSPTGSSSSQLLSSSPFRQLRMTSSSQPSPTQSLSPPSSSSRIVPLPTHPTPPSTSASVLRSPEKQLSVAMEREIQRFRRTQETRVRSFQLEVQEGLSPFRGRKLFPEPEIDDDAILPAAPLPLMHPSSSSSSSMTTDQTSCSMMPIDHTCPLPVETAINGHHAPPAQQNGSDVDAIVVE